MSPILDDVDWCMVFFFSFLCLKTRANGDGDLSECALSLPLRFFLAIGVLAHSGYMN